MANRIILNMTKTEFNALFQMVEDNATFLGGADDDFVDPTLRRCRLVNRMLKRNKIDYVVASAYNGSTFETNK